MSAKDNHCPRGTVFLSASAKCDCPRVSAEIICPFGIIWVRFKALIVFNNCQDGMFNSYETFAARLFIRVSRVVF
jgi:hypothetical protein